MHERGLRDDLGAGPHGFGGLSRRHVEVPRLPERDLDDLAPVGPETLEVGALVQLALAAQELGVLVGDEGAAGLPPPPPRGPRPPQPAPPLVAQVPARRGPPPTPPPPDPP